MKIVHTGDPGILSLRSDVVGCVVVAGLLFTAGGVLTIAFAMGQLPVEASLNPDLKIAAQVVGVLVAMLGLVFVGGRNGKVFDGRRRTLVSWWGFLVPMRSKEVRLAAYSMVVLSKEVRRSKNSSTTLYPIRLEGDATEVLGVDQCLDYLQARRVAEAVSKVARLPLTDSSSGKAVVREPDTLDESLRTRMRRLGERIEIPPRPVTMQSQVGVTSSTVTIDIPGMSARARLIINLIISAVVLGIGILFSGAVFQGGGDALFGEMVPFLIFGGFFAIPLSVILWRIRNFKRPVHVTANRITLTLVEGRKTTEIPGDDLEELSISGIDINQLFRTQPDGSLVVDPSRLDTPEGTTYSAQHGQPPTIPPALTGVVRALAAFAPQKLSILARSDHASVSFGGGLDSAEIAYLYSVIMRVMID